jgi:hypothetical protein
MALQPGDLVSTKTGEVGKVVHINRLTVFVAVAVPDQPDRVEAFLESDLTPIDPPGRGGDAPGDPDARLGS